VSLPLLLSVPHAGARVPREIERENLLTIEQIVRDGDEGVREIYDLQDEVAVVVTTEVARAFLDMNRSDDDRRSDGVVKTETIYQEQIYRRPLREKEINQLLNRYYYLYHRKLSRSRGSVILGIDCHTMAAVAPPIASDAGSARPSICLSDADGSCPKGWTQFMAECLEAEFKTPVSINQPFKGGFIIKSHAAELPWLQLELSRAEFMSLSEKRCKVLAAFRTWCEWAEGSSPNRKEE
jgi:N-formylglutamate deformylase